MDEMLFKWLGKVETIREIKEVVLDFDSSESPVYGEQEGGAYNGYFGLTCYHPLFCFNQFGDCLKVKLRPGNVHSADGIIGFADPIIRYYVSKGIKVKVRGDAAFADPKFFTFCEELGAEYAIRIKSNSRLEELVTVPPWRDKKDNQKVVTVYKDFSYQAVSWDKPRRIVAKIEHHPDELFPRVGFIITSLRWRDKKVVKFYNKRGTCEQWIKEGKYALNWTRLSCQRFVENEARLKLFIMAYNLGNFLRTLVLPEGIKHLSASTCTLCVGRCSHRQAGH